MCKQYLPTILHVNNNKNISQDIDAVNLNPTSILTPTHPHDIISNIPNLIDTSDISVDTSTIKDISDDDPSIVLNQLRGKNTNRLIIGNLNINSLQNKFNAVRSLIQGKIDIFMLSETKIDDSFPLNQFVIEGYSIPFRLDRNAHGGGIIIYIRKDLPCKELKSHKLPDNIEGIFIEFNVHKNKWILMGAYNPHKESSS